MKVNLHRNWYNLVSVNNFAYGDECNVTKECKAKPKYSLFGGDLHPSFSRMCYNSCEAHVGLGVKKILAEK